MELTLEPEIYSPNMNDDGKYHDNVPTSSAFRNGIICPCGSRKENIFKKSSAFSTHIKTKTHQKWLETMNQNRANYYVECEKAKEVIYSQRFVIAKLEKEVASKNMTIDYLTRQLHPQKPIEDSNINLLDI